VLFHAVPALWRLHRMHQVPPRAAPPWIEER
jgi:sterol desaturase/sphingolipid hydroxylase (fatty acid hydroxylase superfamily)